MNAYETIEYNKTLIFVFDVENILNELHTQTTIFIKKMFIYFNKNNIKNRMIKPFAIKFITSSDTDNSFVWSLKDILNNIHFIPLFKINNKFNAEYGMIDIKNTLHIIKRNVMNNTLLQYDYESYDFDITTISSDIINQIITLLEKCAIDYTYKENEYITINDNSQYKIVLNNKVLPNEYNISIRPQLNIFNYNDTQINSIGYFENDNEKLALLIQCPICKTYNIYNYANLKGASCINNSCNNIIKL